MAKKSIKKTVKKPKPKSKVKSKIKAKTKVKPKSKVKARAKTKVKAKARTRAKPKTAPVKTKKTSKLKRKKNLLKLHSKMNKLSVDAVDREVIRRFKIVIETREEDITKISLDTFLKNHKNVDMSSFHESLQPYLKHYLFMIKRDNIKIKK